MIGHPDHPVTIVKKCYKCGKIVLVKELPMGYIECKCGSRDLDFVEARFLWRLGYRKRE